MPKPIEFWFDFASPYGYFAAHEIDDLAARHGRAVIWRPFLLGALFKTTGMKALTQIPMRNEYARHDWERMARRRNIAFRMPSIHPINSVVPGRACTWVAQQDEAKSADLAKALYHAFFTEDRDISQKDTVVDVAASLGHQREEVAAALDDDGVKQAFRALTQEAEERQIFGSPFIIVDGEPFWGSDRLWMVEEWLERGGW